MAREESNLDRICNSVRHDSDLPSTWHQARFGQLGHREFPADSPWVQFSLAVFSDAYDFTAQISRSSLLHTHNLIGFIGLFRCLCDFLHVFLQPFHTSHAAGPADHLNLLGVEHHTYALEAAYNGDWFIQCSSMHQTRFLAPSVTFPSGLPALMYQIEAARRSKFAIR